MDFSDLENSIGVKEKETGNLEYKLKLTPVRYISEERLESLATQMNYRINEGEGEAVYVLGITDDGEPLGISEEELEKSLEVLKVIAEKIHAQLTVIRVGEGRKGKISEILVRRFHEESFPIDINIAQIGNVDSGKSTLAGVLISGELDDGNGSARILLFRHKHELLSGRTSSISTRILGFDEGGAIVNYLPPSPPGEAEILARSSKIINFIDLAGHEKYLRTTIFGLVGYSSDYAMLVVAGNAGILPMTKEHLGVALALGYPIFAIITKIDLAPKEVLDKVIKDLHHLLKLPGVDKIPVMIRDMDDAIVCAKSMFTGARHRIVPVFLVSNTNGEGLDLLKPFFNLLPKVRDFKEKMDQPFSTFIDEVFSVTGVGTVVAGTVLSGGLEVNQEVLLGPFDEGSFRKVRVKSIHYKRTPVRRVIAGQTAAFAIHRIKREDVRKGQVLLSQEYGPEAVSEFEAKCMILYHKTTIKRGYQAVIHCNTIKQTARILWMDKKYLRTGDRATILFQFICRPEYIVPGMRFVFREGRTKGIGVITHIKRKA